MSLHEPLGGLAVLEWGMDEKAALVVANHHRQSKPEPEDILTEVIFLAERIDVAEQRGQTLDIEPLWKAAELTGPLERVKDFLAARADFRPKIRSQRWFMLLQGTSRMGSVLKRVLRKMLAEKSLLPKSRILRTTDSTSRSLKRL